jgi:hypothetical protein
MSSMSSRLPLRQFRQQEGVALFVGLVFLAVLSVVAVIAMRGTIMEMQLVNNVAAHERAFEVSESMRGVPISLFNDHTFNRGWPMAEMGGSVPDTRFGTFPQCSTKEIGSSGVSCNVLKATKIRKTGGALVNLYEISYQDDEKSYDPTTWMASTSGPDMTIAVCDSNSDSDGCTGGGKADLWVRPDGTTLAAGNGAAQAAGYRGVGNAAASGGSSMFFEILSVGTVNSARVVTLSQYRQQISN